MKITVLFALLGSLAFALALMPVLSWFAFKKGVREKETWLRRRFHVLYEPLLRKALRHPLLISVIAVSVFVLSLFATRFLGAEFLPQLDEGSILVEMYRVPGNSIDESLHGNESWKGTWGIPGGPVPLFPNRHPEVATDPMALDRATGT